MSKISEELIAEKPWAILGISRKHYESSKPWKRSKYSRDKFEQLLKLFPDEAIQVLKLNAAADLLTESCLNRWDNLTFDEDLKLGFSNV
ncbi:hypothetical protein [Fundidesulfovibrio soli]|uniref:hypothetical protein n=1 Tax=Fundidesulfovibrio soli TaxID=2922716 RepID=UPI001FAE7866|nr:hypothetical protein [Fundidesulfovibrio soli]